MLTSRASPQLSAGGYHQPSRTQLSDSGEVRHQERAQVGDSQQALSRAQVLPIFQVDIRLSEAGCGHWRSFFDWTGWHGRALGIAPENGMPLSFTMEFCPRIIPEHPPLCNSDYYKHD